jgi:hypothetical protein
VCACTRPVEAITSKDNNRKDNNQFGARLAWRRRIADDDPRWRCPASAHGPGAAVVDWARPSELCRRCVCLHHGPRSQRDRPNTRLLRKLRSPKASSPRMAAGAPPAGHRPSACSGVKALRNLSCAKGGKPPSLLTFRSLDPLRALRGADRRRRDEERPPAPNKEQLNQPNRGTETMPPPRRC